MIILRKLAAPGTSSTCTAVVAGTLAGAINNSNKVYTTTYNYKLDRISILYNGQALHSPEDFLQTDLNEIELVYITPKEGDVLRATYETDCQEPASSIPGLLSGSQPVLINADSQVVSFGKTLEDTNYNLSVDLISRTSSNPSIYGFTITNKTTTGFTVRFSGDIDTSDFSLEWIVIE